MTSSKLKILDFDIENRPLSYWYNGKPSAEITAIASCWVDDVGSMQTVLLGEQTLPEILESFVARYNEADIVTGHYIRTHDLPNINGALLEQGMPKLSPKMTCDTKNDMYKKGDIPASQEYLLALLQLPVAKHHMTQADWREANRLTPKGLEATKARVESDVYGHMIMRAKMLELNLLKGPRTWKP